MLGGAITNMCSVLYHFPQEVVIVLTYKIANLFSCVCVRACVCVCACAAPSVEGKAPLVRTASVTDDFLRFCGRPNHTEKRFFVDRKKLEKLITGKGWVEEGIVYHDEASVVDF